ncbi:hypothetical protein OXH55_05650 [Clostridium ganghwense]|uniref:Uncharacterized protein n=1 Tax=Clostridium ganghwense TaxID=312089 RepID=A0ABT4CPW2_9CLOT|nr:hypothetical protein [Clostridium ganghwense]
MSVSVRKMSRIIL